MLDSAWFIVQVGVGDQEEQEGELFMISRHTHIFGSLLLDDLEYCVIRI